MTFYEKSIDETIKILKTDEILGLKSSEAHNRLYKDGTNEIIDKHKSSILSIFFSQFKDLMIFVLLISALVSLVVSFINGENDYYDFIIILSIVLINGIIGTVQEFKAEKDIEALKSITSPNATVLRNGKKQKIDSKNLVVGDIVILTSGDVSPADIRLLKSVELSSEESSLTGESQPSPKSSKTILPMETPISERENMLFSACGISSGHGKGVVTATGMDTEIGKIAKMLQKEASPMTPLQKKLNSTGKILGLAVVGICAMIFALGLFKSIPALEMLLIAISLAVAAIPEGLTAVVTIVLSLGVKRMAKEKAIVRKLPAVETLGSVDVICSDKTGTLTQNIMTVVEISNISGNLKIGSADSQRILGLASLCNNSEKNSLGKFTGMPTEIAIMKAFTNDLRELQKDYPRIGEIPFTSSRKLMSTVHKNVGEFLVITKGAPDYILNLCSKIITSDKISDLTDQKRKIILEINRQMSKKALRVLAVAKKNCQSIPNNDLEIENDLVFCGLIGIEDPPRKEAKKAVEECKRAGILPIMITGDQATTAVEIAKKISLYDDESKFLTGNEIRNIPQNEFASIIKNYRVFARVSPEDKVKIVKAFQENGNIVAMTGDGINDAPALKSADIGCAMGKNGTEVAKSAADMVLTDDNFATIVKAVKEGRRIFSNIKKTIHFLLSCNMGEILLIVLSFFVGLPIPLLATQILWVNLVTDSFPALALGASKSDKDIMDGSFRNGKNELLDSQMCFDMILEGALIGVISLIAFIVGRNFFDTNLSNPIHGRTMCFAVLCLSQLIHSFNVSSEHSIFSKKREANKWLKLSFLLCLVLLLTVIIVPSLNIVFKTVRISSIQWLIVTLLSLFPLIISEIEKFTSYLFSKKDKYGIIAKK